jgi:hypothetical protein
MLGCGEIDDRMASDRAPKQRRLHRQPKHEDLLGVGCVQRLNEGASIRLETHE